MAKLAAIVAALAAVEANKALADELTTTFGAHAEVELADLAKNYSTIEANATALKEAQAQIGTLSEQVKGFEPARARLEKIDGERRTALMDAALSTAAKAAGIQDAGMKTALTLIDKSKIEVDLEKGDVRGVTKEAFEALKTDHTTLFTPPAQEIPNAPANRGTQNTGKTYSQADFAAGKVSSVAILKGEVQLSK